MVLFRDLGFISQQMYEMVDSKCKDKGSELPKECTDLLDQVDELVDGFNIYDAFKPCYQNNNVNGQKLSWK